MYPGGVASPSKSAKKTAASTPGDEDDSAIVSSFRVSKGMLDKFDAWVARQNVGRRGPKLSRADVIRGLMDWAADQEPDWEGRGAGPPLPAGRR
jgi:hypothetical protein